MNTQQVPNSGWHRPRTVRSTRRSKTERGPPRGRPDLSDLPVLRAEIGSLDRVRRIVKVVGWVNSAPGFTRQPWVINGASDLLIEVFGEAGRHARTSIGANELPFNIPVEIEMIVEVAPR